MIRRKLGDTDLELPVISYGASSLGQEFRRVAIEEALQSCRVALEVGMEFSLLLLRLPLQLIAKEIIQPML